MNIMKKAAQKYSAACITTHVKVGSFIREHTSVLLALLGIVLIAGGVTEIVLAQATTGDIETRSEADFQDGLIRAAVANLFRLIEGAFGALIMVVSGLGAIVAAAMGAYRAAVGMLVVAVGAFILRSLVSLFFGTEFQEFSQGS